MQSKVLGDGPANARHPIDIFVHPFLAPNDREWHVLAGVIGARVRRIVAVVGGEDEEVVGFQRLQQMPEPDIELF